MLTPAEKAEARRLVRLRADPRKVRVSVLRFGVDIWWATVESTVVNGMRLMNCRASAADAIDAALERAEAAHMPGIDLGLEWAYEHPQGRHAR